jgi:hypothetical protein
MCDYAEDAVVLLPGQTFVGREAIQAGLSNFAALLGGVVPQITSLTATNDVVLITFTALGSPCTIPDGSDTYIVKKGRIAAQTVHDTLFSAPGMVCPLAVAGKWRSNWRSSDMMMVLAVGRTALETGELNNTPSSWRGRRIAPFFGHGLDPSRHRRNAIWMDLMGANGRHGADRPAMGHAR